MQIKVTLNKPFIPIRQVILKTEMIPIIDEESDIIYLI